MNDFDADAPKLVSLQTAVESDINTPVCYAYDSTDEELVEMEVEAPAPPVVSEDSTCSSKRPRAIFCVCKRNMHLMLISMHYTQV